MTPQHWYENRWASLVMAAILVLLAWAGLARWVGLDSFPSPWAALGELPALISDPMAWSAILQSVGRMFAGYALALVVAVPLGLAMGRSRLVYTAFYPLVALAYPMPKAALMPILMLWFGLGDFSKILVIALGVSLPLLYHSYHGATRIEPKLIWVAQSMGMGPLARLGKIVLPASLPEVMIGCRVGVVMALIVMVSSEMIARQEGIGNLLFTSMDMAQYSTVYAVIMLLAVLGIAFDALFEFVRKRCTHWHDSTQSLMDKG
ncbi:ABC transporter permease [Providencia rettgeri]|uniref:ABC transporter permease n=1 Tax=Alcaligenes parafaecalis TaxID=171260 RepID=A0ABT3VPF9_9BURK|nr:MULTISPECIES: ABC transporter permease [Alcaligenes]MBY6346019.1 ABC transporter permease [Providencia rettgeri]MCX5465423.1 ABC transporter permease [Alcaligenes parafaecalis]